MIQLQHLGPGGRNVGGLYVRPEDVSVVYAVCKKDETAHSYIVLRCGREFRTAQSVSELLDVINKPKEMR